MSTINKTSSGGRLQPYQKPGFTFDSDTPSDIKILGELITDEELLEIRKARIKSRSFYIPENTCLAWGIPYYGKGCKLIVAKQLMYESMKQIWDKDHLERWENLGTEKITLVNNGLSWWVALG